MKIILLIILAVIFVNTIAAIITVFRQPRNIAAIWGWLLVLIFIPVLGFLFYAFFGRRLPKSSLLRLEGSPKKDVTSTIKKQKKQLGHFSDKADSNNEIVNSSSQMVDMFMNVDDAPLLGHNEVKTFLGGDTFVDQLFKDFRNAKSSINIEFYTFASDKIGQEALQVLVECQKRGVDVKVIYDAWGSMGTHEKFFKPLIEAGGHAYPSLDNKFNILDMRVNFRDHHKLITIDGKLGYIGGLNLGDQYMGWDPKFGNWRDCMMRVHGDGVYGLQSRFLVDWNASDPHSDINPNDPKEIAKYYPKIESNGKAIMQIVSSGPDTLKEQIKMGYIKLIQSAKKSIKITTPYLDPDPSVIEALRIAVNSGVDVKIITPDMPDHPFVFRVTQYYTKLLTSMGVQIYEYNDGFMHAKTIVADDKWVSIGSANFDYRSFALNFECNAFVYDKGLANHMEKVFEEDLQHSTYQTQEIFDSQSWWLDFKQYFSRLLSPLM